MKQTRTGRWAALALAFAMMWTAACGAAYAQEATPQTMTLSQFLDAVIAGNGTFDGNGVTVKWKPDERVNVIHRVQQPNAQYQLFADRPFEDLTISNVHFEYVPDDIPNHSDGWSGLNNDWSKDKIRNAEFQFWNTGNTTLTNCTFEKIITSPFGNGMPSDKTFTVTGCTYRNVYDAYATKDIFQSTTVISGNTFQNCSGAIYFRENTIRNVTIANNQFVNIDQYASQSLKKNYRGVIQFDTNCRPNKASVLTIADNTITDNLVNDGQNGKSLPVLRQICNMEGVMLNGWTPGEAFSTKIESRKTLTLPDMPSNSQYAFRGWAKAGDYKGPTTGVTSADRLKPSGAQVTGGFLGTFYYAVWEKQIVNFTVTYTDGVDGETIFADQTITAAAGSSTPAFNGTPAREGYVFKGWTPAVSEKVTGNVIYTARWEKEPAKAPAAPPKTGDSSSPWLWLTLMLAAGGGLAGMSMRRKAGR